MSKVLYIFCEGETEEAVLKNFLRQYWSIRFSDCEVFRYSGAGDLKARFARDALIELKADPDSSVLCLVDLYKEPFGVYDKTRITHAEGFNAVREQLLGQIKSDYHHRFGAFPVVMELETWLLADPNIQSKIGNTYSAPEEIEHPAQELKNQRGRYSKLVDGKNLFNQASAKRVYDDSCPHFRLLVEWLVHEPEKVDSESVKQLAKQAEYLHDLIAQRDAALEQADKYLKLNNLDEAVIWDEKRKALDDEIQEYNSTYHEK